jgi:hypothetical protein
MNFFYETTGGLNKIIFSDAKIKNCVTINSTLAEPKMDDPFLEK